MRTPAIFSPHAAGKSCSSADVKLNLPSSIYLAPSAERRVAWINEEPDPANTRLGLGEHNHERGESCTAYVEFIKSGESNLVCSTSKHREMAAQIAHDTKSIDEFAHILSHRLRVPVANALGLVELLKNGVASGSDNALWQEMLCTAVQEIDNEIKALNSVLWRHRERIIR